MRWRRIDFKWVVEQRFGVVYHERAIGELLNHIGFFHIQRTAAPSRLEGGDDRGAQKNSRRRLSNRVEG